MSELRLNPITREWVIIAKEKGKKPEDFTIVKEQERHLNIPIENMLKQKIAVLSYFAEIIILLH
ncbi:MAG: hypothetical protein Q6358_12005 [Candidatus Brocadiales bacterium]|nr:hypothetical protein [Candidatus Brocadiales bacterium]